MRPTGDPSSSVRSQRTACKQSRGGGADQDSDGVAPPKQRALPEHGIQEREEMGGTPHQEGEGGGTPRAGAHAIRARPDTRDGGQPGSLAAG